MTTLTLAPANGGFTNDPAYAAGRADAHDDHNTTPVPVLHNRIGVLVDHHPDLAYVLGYAARVIEIQHERAAEVAAQTELAHTSRRLS